MRYKLLFVDDEESILNMLKKNFEIEGYEVYTATTSELALEQLKFNPDLILLDINMPGIDGIEFCTLIREHISCPILFLTARVTEQDKINGFMAGGDDYITKPFSIDELLARVSAHLRREQRHATVAHVRFFGHLMIDYNARSVFWNKDKLDFSNKEFEIIRFLSVNAGMVFDRETIYEKLWGFDGEGDSIVIKEHIRKIRNKLAVHTDREYIKTVWGVGYQWVK